LQIQPTVFTQTCVIQLRMVRLPGMLFEQSGIVAFQVPANGVRNWTEYD
jgi:hypothetical protein